MNEKKEKIEVKIKKAEKKVAGAAEMNNPKEIECQDKKCPFHGELSVRGREFKGTVTKIFPKRLTIEFERFIFIPKFERYMKKKSRIHARLPDCLAPQVKIGSYVKIAECRPLSKIIHHVVIGVNK